MFEKSSSMPLYNGLTVIKALDSVSKDQLISLVYIFSKFTRF